MLVLDVLERGTVMKNSIVALSMVLAVPAAAEEISHAMDGNRLFKLCTGPSQVERAACYGYMEGVLDSLNAHLMIDEGANCVRAGIQTEQVHDVVVNYLRAHPERRHGVAAVLASAAMIEAWCPTDDAPATSSIPEQPRQPQWKPVPVKKPLKPLPLDPE
jgi:hypothetical protein